MHEIIGIEDERINHDKEISIGSDVWICAGSSILKGAVLPNKCVIGANSLVSTVLLKEKMIYAGNPVQEIKEISKWS